MILEESPHILSLSNDMVDCISTMDIIIPHLPRSQHRSEEENRNVWGKAQKIVERGDICLSGSQVTSVSKDTTVLPLEMMCLCPREVLGPRS